MLREHTVKSFDEELERLKNVVLLMGGTTEEQINDSIQALIARDNNLAIDIIEKDKKIDDLEDKVDRLTIRVLSLRQPMSIDLRTVMAATKIATDLERISDYAGNIAMHIPSLNSSSVEKAMESIVDMARVAQGMLKEALESYRDSDVDKAIGVWHRDDEIDNIYPRLMMDLRDLMKSNPENIESYTSLILVGRSIERIGDHITNIAEQVYFIVNGEIYHRTREVQA